MNILNTFEDRVSAIFDTTSQGFRAPFSFKRLAKQAIREMDKETFVVNGVDTAPALFTILVSPVDDVAIRPFYTKLTKEIQQLVEAQAERKHSSFIGEPLVRFMVDQSLRSGKFSVFAENVDARTLRRLHAEEDTFLDSLGARRTRGRAKPERGGLPEAQPQQEREQPGQHQAKPAGRQHAPGSRAGERQAKRAAHGATSAQSTAQQAQQQARAQAQRAEGDPRLAGSNVAGASSRAVAAAGSGAASLNPLPSLGQAAPSPAARAAQVAQAEQVQPAVPAHSAVPVAPTMRRPAPARPAARQTLPDIAMDPEASGDYAAVIPASGYVPPLSTGAAGMLPAAGGASFGSYSRSRDQRLSATYEGSVGLFGRHPMGAVAQQSMDAPLIQPGPQQSYVPFPDEVEPEPEPEQPAFWTPTPVARPTRPAEPEEDRFNPQPEEDPELNEPPVHEEEHEPVTFEPKAAKDPFAAKFAGIMDLEDDALAGPYASTPNFRSHRYEPELDLDPNDASTADRRAISAQRTAFEPPVQRREPTPSPAPAPVPPTQPAPQARPAADHAAQAEPQPGYAATPRCMLYDRQSGHTYTASAPGATLGRERGGGGIVLADPNISRKHAELAWDGAYWHIIDLNSTNGTLVNNTDVRDCVLADGDVVTLGLINLEFREVTL